MQTVEFLIPTLNGNARADDLGNVLNGISGVGHVDLDVQRHTVRVEYDPAFVSPQLMKRSVEGSGYSIERAEKLTS